MEMNFRSTTRGLKLVKTKYMGLVEFETEYIPDWFLEEVLSRLPLKCVVRLKCVSKQWLSFISAPSFVNLYISRVSLSHKPLPWTVLSHRLHVKGTKFCPDPPLMLDDMLSADENDLIEYPVFSRYLYLPLPQRSSWRERYDIVAVSDGLVLYGRIVFMENSINHMTDYHLYNPITHQCVALPPPFLCFRFVSTGFLTQIEGGTLKNYKVVRFGCQLWEWHNLEFEIFCSETGSWRRVVVHSDQAIQIAWLRMPFSFSGMLHWIDRWLGIVACDPCRDSNQCRIIGLPSDIDKQCNNYKNNGLYSLCNVHQGRLRYFEVSLAPSDPFGFSGFSLWVLDDYDSATWSLLHRAKVTDILFDDILTSQGLTGSCPAPLAFHPFDGNIVCLSLGAYIVTYNAKTLKLEAHGNPVATEYFYESTGWLSWYAQVPEVSILVRASSMASFYPKISFHGKEGGWCLVDLLKNIEMAEPEYIMNDMCFIFFNEVRPQRFNGNTQKETHGIIKNKKKTPIYYVIFIVASCNYCQFGLCNLMLSCACVHLYSFFLFLHLVLCYILVHLL